MIDDRQDDEERDGEPRGAELVGLERRHVVRIALRSHARALPTGLEVDAAELFAVEVAARAHARGPRARAPRLAVALVARAGESWREDVRERPTLARLRGLVGARVRLALGGGRHVRGELVRVERLGLVVNVGGRSRCVPFVELRGLLLLGVDFDAASGPTANVDARKGPKRGNAARGGR